MSALHAYQMAEHHRSTAERTCAAVNRDVARLAEQLADDGLETEPNIDLSHLWNTSDQVRTRPRDPVYLKLHHKPYAFFTSKSTTQGAAS